MNIETVLKEAFIYRSGCTVTRKGTVHLVPGENHVRIAGMTSSAYTDTMQLRIDPSVRAYAIHIIQKDEDDKEAAHIADEINEKKELIAVLKEQAEMWKAGAEFAQSANASLSDVETYINSYPKRVKEIHAEIRGIEKEIRKLNRLLNKASDRDARPLISAVLKAQQEKDYPFELVYQETSAFWNTQYEIDADTNENTLDVRVRAEVRQNTGEDWNQVKLALRTGHPVNSASLPVLDPVYLDFRPPVHKPIYGGAMPMMASMKAAANTAMEEMMMEDSATADTAQFARIEMDEAEVSSGDTMTEYVPASLYDIASGDDGLTIDLQSFTLKADFVTKAVPKKDIRAYLLAEIKTSDLPAAIHGNAAVYLDGTYTGTSIIAPDYGKETYAVALGLQEAISLSRKEIKKKSSEAFIRNSQSAVYECEICVSNNRDVPVTLSVSDQIPVASDAAISVEVINDDHAVRKEKTGMLEWKLELQPQQTKTLRTEYRVTWPKDKPLHQSTY